MILEFTTDGLLFYLCFMATLGLIVKVLQLALGK